MKKSRRLPFTLLTLCVALLPVAGLWAQAPAADATPSVSAPAKTGTTATTPAEAEENEGAMRARAMTMLTPEEQGKLRAARRAALQDPEVKAAEATRSTDKKGYRKAVTAAMIKSDPSVKEILEKLRDSKPRKKQL